MESQRFPGKPLAPILNIPMVIRCAKNAIAAGYITYICTDSNLIVEAANQYNINSIFTPVFDTGTDRVNWAANEIDAEWIINLQGDEPLIEPESIQRLGNEVFNTAKRSDLIVNGLIDLENEFAYDPNNIKAVVRIDNSICYLSRKAIKDGLRNSVTSYTKQLGIYAFHREALNRFASLEQSPLELAERIEMLRWIDNGMLLKAAYLETKSISVDTPEDLLEVERILAASQEI